MNIDERLRLLYWSQGHKNPLVATYEAPEITSTQSNQPKIDIPFKEIFGMGGAAITGTAYAMTYPIVWLDGPLPIVDGLWLAGFALAVNRGYRLGSRIGKGLDVIEEVLL